MVTMTRTSESNATTAHLLGVRFRPALVEAGLHSGRRATPARPTNLCRRRGTARR